ncbi:MAG: hypothetical protein NVS1B3_07570 [Candidatus Dormibacteraceae bacterium]
MHSRRRSRTFLLRLAAAGLILGCGGTPSATVAPKPVSPPASASQAPTSPDPEKMCIWPEDLSFSGAFSLYVNKTDCVGQEPSSCTGASPAPSGTWSARLPFVHEYGEWHKKLYIDVRGFHGPGTYDGHTTFVSVVKFDESTKWQNGPADPAAFTIDSSLETGTIDVTLTNSEPGNLRALMLRGKWTCKGMTG